MAKKLYVWDDHFCGYAPGLAVVLADSVEQARELLTKCARAKAGGGVPMTYWERDIAATPKEFDLDVSIAWFLEGGG